MGIKVDFKGFSLENCFKRRNGVTTKEAYTLLLSHVMLQPVSYCGPIVPPFSDCKRILSYNGDFNFFFF